jgi:predicted PurR-regulated permease PerM
MCRTAFARKFGQNSAPMTANWKDVFPWAAAALVLALLLWLLAPILTPFVIGAGLAYLGDPLVDALQRRRLSRTTGVVIVFTVLTLAGLIAALLILPLLYKQFVELLQNIPVWLQWLQNNALPRLGIVLPEGLQLDATGLRSVVAEHWSQAGGIMARVWAGVSESGGALIAAGASLLLVPVVSFYLLRDWDELVAWIGSMIPPRLLPRVTGLALETDQVLGAFLRGQLSVMLALALIYSIGLALCGLKLALVIGIGAGLLSFVPYLGFIVGFGAAAIAMLVQTGEWLPLVWVALVFTVGQVIESSLLTPILVGDKIGLHPVAVIFAVMAGGQLFGFIGVLAALPVAAVLAVLLRHAKRGWLQSPVYLRDAPAVAPTPPAE